MKIYSMTATFGKLEHQTLTLEPGLNVIHAPNEWGKSTWCAFLVAMLYGIDTKERTKQGSLADKERYAPWSGSPMSGRIALNWNGRNITIERSTRGRVIFGEFKAYETDTGLPVTELTAANCGQVLLGVEKSVFTRAGFIKLTDLPVSDDEALRRRLNALVTTGDESGASDTLAQKLKDLKNRCRFNKSGLLPQAELQRDQLQEKLTQLQQLQEASARIGQQLQENATKLEQLENHRDALEYAAAQDSLSQVAHANARKEALATQLQQLQSQVLSIPTLEDAQQRLGKLQQLQQQISDLQQQERQLPEAPASLQEKAPFHGLDDKQTQAMLDADISAYQAMKSAKPYIPFWLIGLAGIIAAVVIAFLVPQLRYLGALIAVAGIIPMLIYTVIHREDRKKCIALESKYGSPDCALWQKAAAAHIEAISRYEEETIYYREAKADFDRKSAMVREQLEELTGGAPIAQIQQKWEGVQGLHIRLGYLQKEYAQACDHAAAIAAVVKDVPAPAGEDTLVLDAAQTQAAIAQAMADKAEYHKRLGQYQGQMDALGQEAELRRQLDGVQQQIRQLEATYHAAILGLETLAEASASLQRKFAPRISNRAQALFGKLTGSRYDRLILGEDLSLQTAAQNENTLRSDLWRSDGTADQLYLALRLAVAEELTAQAPLVLDDALVRFDDTRLAQAMDILKDAAQKKQVILFTCQGREKHYL